MNSFEPYVHYMGTKRYKEFMSYVSRCEMCEGNPPPLDSGRWRIIRKGDVALTWACDDHLAQVCRRMDNQRRSTHGGPAELIVSVADHPDDSGAVRT